MKRFAVLAFMAAFVLSTVGMAYATELKVRGTWRVQLNLVENADFNSATTEDTFSAQQRMRTIFEFVASEKLMGLLELEIGDLRWGHAGVAAGRGVGGAFGTDGVNIETRRAFIRFNVPDTRVRVDAGLQTLSLPSTFGSHILRGDVGAVVVSAPLNPMVSLTTGWARALDATTALVTRNDEQDIFFAVLPIRTDGARVNPFVALSQWSAGVNPVAAENTNMWHAGVNFEVMAFMPITIRGDLNYGTVEWREAAPALEQSGWVAALAAQYAMFNVTPQIFAVYERGEDATANESERMPAINTDGGAFGPGVGLGDQTSFAGANFLRRLLDDTDPQADQGAIGMWVLGAALRDIKLVDKLSHDLVVFWARGTNDNVVANIDLFTTEDSYWEMNFNTEYELYEELTLILELAYAKANMETAGMFAARDADLRAADDAMTRAVLGLVYRF